MRPAQARREKPRVSAFTSANIDKILALGPGLVLTFSDLQADIAADLIRRGLNVHASNQRSVAGILDMIRMLGAMVDASERAEEFVGALEAGLAEARTRADNLKKRPRGFFEEWNDPLISGIAWVSELVEIAGGIDIFADLRNQAAANMTRFGAVELIVRDMQGDEITQVGVELDPASKPGAGKSFGLRDRVVMADEVVAREPDLIIGSWCGKKFRPERVAARSGFAQTPAVQHQDLYEIKSSLILQPGPAALTDGLAELQRIIERWAIR